MLVKEGGRKGKGNRGGLRFGANFVEYLPRERERERERETERDRQREKRERKKEREKGRKLSEVTVTVPADVAVNFFSCQTREALFGV